MTRNAATVHSPSSTTSNSAKLSLPQTCDPPSPSNPPKQRAWMIFGASGHIGRSVLKTALAHGDIVTAVGKLHADTLQSMASLVAPLPPLAAQNSSQSPAPPPAANIKHQHSHPRYLPLLCDVRLPVSVAAAIQTSRERWGRIDIIANCSGYGVIGACEDQDDSDIRGQLETNFFGTLNIIQASLPYFRARGTDSELDSASEDNTVGSDEEESAQGQDETEPSEDNSRTQSRRAPRRRQPPPLPKRRGGRYLIFSSTSGALGVPGLGPYCATKYAVEGLVESLQYEIDTFGIRATLVEPGHVRRDDILGNVDTDQGAGKTEDITKPTAPVESSSTDAALSHLNLPTFGHFLVKPPSAPYAGKNSPAAHARRMVQWLGDKQPTSAVRAAELVWQLGHCRYPPLRLLLGSYAVESVRDRLRTIMEEIEDWKFLNFGGQPGNTGQDARSSTEQKGGEGEHTTGTKTSEQKDEAEGDGDDEEEESEGEGGEEEDEDDEDEDGGGDDNEEEVEDEDTEEEMPDADADADDDDEQMAD